MNYGQCPNSIWQASLYYGILPTIGFADQTNSYSFISGESRMKFYLQAMEYF